MTDQGQSTADQGIAAFREGRLDDAVRLLTEATSRDRRNYRAYLILGAAHIQRREHDDAIDAFEAAREVRPDLAHIHYNLGLAYQKAGRPQEAVAAFRAALEVDPSYDKAREALDRAAPGPAAPPAPRPAPAAPEATRTGGPQMPTVPDVQPLTGPPPAPWESTGAAAREKAPEPAFELRPLGGGMEARRMPGEPAAPGKPDEPARAPWEMEGMQVRPMPRPRPGGPEEPPLLRPGAKPGGRSGVAGDAGTATQGQRAAAGAVAGAMFGATFMVVVTVLDRILGRQWALLSRAGVDNWGMLFIGGGMAGAVFGAIIGAVACASRKLGNGIIMGIALWVVAAFLLLLRSDVPMGPVPIFSAALDGLVMGWLVASQAMSSIKRK
jgi:hypothetical protein